MKLVNAVELMEANIKEPISQVELADYVDLSRRQLQRARELLLQTNLGLVEIGAQTGFVSISHFSKSYKEVYGYSPSVERRGSRESPSRQ
jgi:transcriptional regulator GlxA family with amidase domain